MGRGWILIVDDDAAGRDRLALQLTGAGYTVRAVPQAGAAVSLRGGPTRQPPALILLDAALPRMDLPSFLAAYGWALNPPAPLVLLVAPGDEGRVPAVDTLRVRWVLHKPVAPGELRLVVAHFTRPAA
jgi:DNA-binding response OmpR family regulator